MQVTRWTELRDSYFHPDSLIARFDQCYDTLCMHQVFDKEKEVWDGIDNFHLDFEAEMELIRQWIPQRVAFLDSVYHYTAPSAIEQISTEDKQPERIYNLLGQQCYRNAMRNHFFIVPGSHKVRLLIQQRK